jgi:mannose/fructose/N-acetylgalactosamine-specific phosphotransferase system component IIB
MGSLFVRTDDRFIHGQVTTGWARKVGARKILLVNDAIAQDQLVRKLQRLSAGPGVEVEFHTLQSAIEQIRSGGLAVENEFLLVETPADLVPLVEAGLNLSEVNLGNLRFEPGRRKVANWLFVDERQILALKALSERGIRLVAQWMIGQESINVNDWLAKHG